MGEITRWRLSHRERGRSMTAQTAAALLGIGMGTYNKQVTGQRPVSRRSKMIMFLWDMLDENQQDRALTFARGLKSEDEDTG